MKILSLIFIRQSRASWLLFVTAATFLYLIVEFSFNSRLLDVVGGKATPDEVESIEIYGRLISGFAAALCFWPLILGNGIWSNGKKYSILFGVSLLLVVVVYYAEKKLVDHLVNTSSAQTRYVAANLVLLQRAILSKDAMLEDLVLSKGPVALPDEKAFLAMFPLLAFSTEEVDQKIKNIKSEILRRNITSNLGGRTEYFNHYYVDSVKEIERIYNESYVPGSNQHAKTVNAIPQKQAEEWHKYVSELRNRYDFTPWTVHRRYWKRVRSEVQDSGVNVSSDWIPSDRQGFDEAIAREVKKIADREFKAGIEKVFPGGDRIPFKSKANTLDRLREMVSRDSGLLQPGLSFSQFSANELVQYNWRMKLGNFATSSDILRVDMDESTFFSKFYNPLIDLKLAEQMAMFDAPPTKFLDGAELESFGKQGMRSLLVPPIALAFSLLGAIVHIFKFVFFGMQLSTTITFRYGLVKWLATGLSTILVFVGFNQFLSSEVTKQPLYKYFDERISRIGNENPIHTGWIAAHAIRGTIHGQTIAYPAFEWVRRNVMMGAQFGYKE